MDEQGRRIEAREAGLRTVRRLTGVAAGGALVATALVAGAIGVKAEHASAAGTSATTQTAKELALVKTTTAKKPPKKTKKKTTKKKATTTVTATTSAPVTTSGGS